MWKCPKIGGQKVSVWLVPLYVKCAPPSQCLIRSYKMGYPWMDPICNSLIRALAWGCLTEKWGTGMCSPEDPPSHHAPVAIRRSPHFNSFHFWRPYFPIPPPPIAELVEQAVKKCMHLDGTMHYALNAFILVVLQEMWYMHSCTREIPDLIYNIPPCVMESSAMGLKLGVFGFLPTTHTKNKCAHDLRTPCGNLHMFIFALRLQ